jgi:hypothetical protein
VGRKAAIFGKESGNKPKSGRLDRSLVNQHDRESVSHWVNAVALITLQCFGIRSALERLVTDRTSEQFK